MTASSISRRLLVTGLTLVMISLSGCASSREDYLEAVDGLCGKVNERFGKELSVAGDSFGTPEQLDKLAKRAEAIKGLRADVAKLDVPEETARPDAWLTKLDAYVAEMEELHTLYRTARRGSDLALAMSVGIHDDKAVEAGQAAAAYGLDVCAKVENWQIFPGSS